MSKAAITTTAVAICFVLACALVFGTAQLLDPNQLSAQSPVRISEVCLDCHDQHNDNLLGTPHFILAAEMDEELALIACTDCHPGDERHWDDDPEEYFVTNPDSTRGLLTQAICSNCHVNSHQQNMMEGNPHSASEVNCTGCHKIHESKHARLLKSPQPDLCLGCHVDVRGQFAKPFRHPSNDGVMACSDCHMTTAETQHRLSFSGTTAACVSCHNEFQGPFPFEHQASVDYSTEGGSCLECHDPHGSYLPRMLRKPYEAPHFNLCTQCHAVPKHNSNINHGTTFAGVPCNECHVDIHGSYTSRLYLSPALEAQGCLNVGCHQG